MNRALEAPPGCDIEGYVIVSRDGMLADAARVMPDSLQIAGDQTFFSDALDGAALIIHGRHSREDHAHSGARRRLIVTRRVGALAPDPHDPRAMLWNPQGAALQEACARAGVDSGRIAIIGGPDIFAMFLDVFARFYLSEAPEVTLPGGTLAIADPQGRHPADVLRAHGLEPGAPRLLDTAPRAEVRLFRRTAPPAR